MFSTLISAALFCVCFAITTIPHPPTMTRQPPHEQPFLVCQDEEDRPYILEDKPYILECDADGNPEPEYSWIKDGKEFEWIEEGNRITQQHMKGTLEVNKPYDTDEGIYQCFAKNVHGTAVSNAVHLRKSELNSFTDEEIKDELVVEGEPLSITCKAPSGYPKPVVFWMVQYSTGAMQSINSSRITVDPHGNLHFSNVTYADALDDALYACSATSMFRNEYKLGNKILLRVEASVPENKPPTQMYVSPPNIVVLRGQKLELSCIFGGTPVPEIIWTKKGGNLLSHRVHYMNYGKTLRIREADFQDEGTYVCTASNGVGTPLSQLMEVTVQAAPYWINEPKNTNGIVGENVTFECVAGGIPMPDVAWFMNGIPLEDTQDNPRRRLDASANVLTIEGLQKTDTSVFQCNASNIHGYTFKNFYLSVLCLCT